MTRAIMLTASLVCAVIAALIGFEVLDVAVGKVTLLCCAWAAFALVFLVAAELYAELAPRVRR